MSALTDYAEAKILDFLFRGTIWLQRPPTLYFGLLTAEPSDTTPGTEVAAGGYARVSKPANTTNFGGLNRTASTDPLIQHGGIMANGVAIAFPKATANWGTVTHIAVYDAASAGNMILWKALNSPAPVSINEVLTFAVGDLQFSFDGNIGNWAATALLNLLFCSIALPTISTMYFALGTGADGTGISGETFGATTGGNYQRLAVANNSNTWSAAVADADPQKNNAVALDFIACNEAAGWSGTLTHFIAAFNDKGAWVSCTAVNATEYINKTAHGLVAGQKVRFKATTMPSGLSFGTDYYVLGVDANNFQVALTPGGAAVTFTTDGTAVFYRLEHPAGTTFTADAGTDVLSSTSHGLHDGDTVRVFSTTTLPLNLAVNTDYYVRDVSGNTFKLSSTPGGAPIDVDAGSGTHTIWRVNERVIWHGQLGSAIAVQNTNQPGWAVGQLGLSLD